jgi:hypothetical protein
MSGECECLYPASCSTGGSAVKRSRSKILGKYPMENGGTAINPYLTAAWSGIDEARPVQ